MKICVTAGVGSDHVDLNAAVDKGLEVIERNARMQAQLVSDLLDVSRIVTGKLHVEVVPLEIDAVVRAALEDLRAPAIAKGVALRAQLEALDVPVHGDANRLQQVVVNLVSNAIKFTPRGGLVDLTLERSGPWVVLTVRDTGPGIPPEVRPYLFEPFFTTKPEGEGTGLGLATVYGVVTQVGGRVDVESEPGRGAAFHLRLPRVEGPAG